MEILLDFIPKDPTCVEALGTSLYRMILDLVLHTCIIKRTINEGNAYYEAYYIIMIQCKIPPFLIFLI